MHCPRCGASAAIGQTFCRACGLSLEKIPELLGEQAGLAAPGTDNDLARLRERQQKLERWAGIAGLSALSLLFLVLIVVVFSQMILKGGPVALAGLLIILFFLGVGIMGGFQAYSKYLKDKLTERPLPLPLNHLQIDTTAKLEGSREPLASITDRTTELLKPPESH